VNALWLLPFYPSPLRDDGYDIADYMSINPSYGTMRDFKKLLREAHAREVKVITELVINHTSDQHPWFQRARHAPPVAQARDFSVCRDTTDHDRHARSIYMEKESTYWTAAP
jgi:maltose alpha-D-glucosyltransferase/alpha-amylase